MKNNKPLNIAIVGATGLVGKELVSILAESKLNINELTLFASKKSAGDKIEFDEDELVVKELKSVDDINADLVFLAVNSKMSFEIAPKLVKKGAMVIDKSAAFRKNDLLIVPGVNGHLLDNIKAPCVISSPNCVATPLAEVLFHLHKAFGLSRVIVSTYQAVSGAGSEAFEELETQVRNLFNFKEINHKAFDKRIAFNVLANIPSFGLLNIFGQTDEEEKVIIETKKILNLPNLLMQATCVRVPVFNGHCMSVDIETDKEVCVKEIANLLAQSDAIVVQDDVKNGSYPCSLESSSKDEIFVGRIRPTTAFKNGISLWIAADNLRVGAALNAVRIAQRLYA